MDKPIAKKPVYYRYRWHIAGESHLLFFSSMSGSPLPVAGSSVPMQKT